MCVLALWFINSPDIHIYIHPHITQSIRKDTNEKCLKGGKITLVKFHFNDCPKTVSMTPESTPFLSILYKGCVLSPFSHSSLPKIGNVACFFSVANFSTCSLVPGSWAPKLLLCVVGEGEESVGHRFNEYLFLLCSRE